ncbi:PREDICTED: vomeronasal type-1 receptor 1-like [Dipodomys ordii]|uniref:Vomeronasal type-1 receptor n=1 Tax=Dipodomys ordii TaxID=10020 RepID=A0A1S3G3Z9_DIPOR|nr:PREDICTED: vomeronasal type-1 receptor 1-like [Dipodomys ordii]
MFPRDSILVLFLLLELFLGFLGNSLLFSLSVHSCLHRPALRKPLDLILAHLALTNALSAVCRLILDLLPLLVSDLGCRALLYAYSVTRALNICTLSLLTAFQATTLHPGLLTWAWLQCKAPSFIFPTCLSFWIFNLLLYLPVLNRGPRPGNYSGPAASFLWAPSESGQLHYRTFTTLFLYMVTFLYMHRHTAGRLRSPTQVSPLQCEIKTTHSILTLVAFFGDAFGLNSFVTFYSFYRPQENSGLEKMSRILSSCYPAICPFVLMRHRRVISKFIASFSKMRISLMHSRCRC